MSPACNRNENLPRSSRPRNRRWPVCWRPCFSSRRRWRSAIRCTRSSTPARPRPVIFVSFAISPKARSAPLMPRPRWRFLFSVSSAWPLFRRPSPCPASIFVCPRVALRLRFFLQARLLVRVGFNDSPPAPPNLQPPSVLTGGVFNFCGRNVCPRVLKKI